MRVSRKPDKDRWSLTDTSNLTRILSEVEPDEVCNLGWQSIVAVSFEAPEYIVDVGAMGTLRLFEAIRLLGLDKMTRFYQAIRTTPSPLTSFAKTL